MKTQVSVCLNNQNIWQIQTHITMQKQSAGACDKGQADLRDIADPVPDHHNEASHNLFAGGEACL